MRRVLFMAYHFPPVGGAGVQRSLQFARHLPAHDYEPVVVTGPGEASGEWMPIDASLERHIAGAYAIDRVPGPVPEPISDARARVERLLCVDSPFIRWWERGARSVGSRHPEVDVVYASLSPYETAFAAGAVARRLDVPLVLDLRDPWALDEMLTWSTGVHHRLDLRRMRRGLAGADAVVMNTAEAARRLRETFPELADTHVAVVPNGFDSTDFAEPAAASPVERFRIVHTGALHTAFGHGRRRGRLRRHLGGLPDGDPYTRSHVYLMRAIGALIEARPELRDVIEVHLAGTLSDADRAVEGHGTIHEHGYLAHTASVALMRSADLLFLPMHDLPAGRRATIVPGKTYEYLASGRPLLAAVPEGDARDLLARLPWAHVCEPSNAGAMGEIVASHIDRKRPRGSAEPDGDVSLVRAYDRRELTRELAGVFDRVLAGRPSTVPPDPVAA